MKKYIGCSGYHYADWKEKFYPEDLKKKEWLNYYANHTNTLEIYQQNCLSQTPRKR